MVLRTLPFDAAEGLDDAQSIAYFLEDAFAGGDAAEIAHALGVVARARGVAKIAEAAGVTREALYKSLTAEGDPRLSTLVGVMKALGLRLQPQQIERVRKRA